VRGRAVTGNGNNSIDAGAGDDVIITDVVHAGGGNDVDGGAGDDCLTGGAGKDLLIGGDGKDVLTGDASNDVLIGGSIVGPSDAQLVTILHNWVNASSCAGVAAVTDSSGTKLITDGVNQNVFSGLFDDKLTGNSGQDLFLADVTLDEVGAVQDTITDSASDETTQDVDRQ
jgi:Ca2+-binding RTX toxin-like protein